MTRLGLKLTALAVAGAFAAAPQLVSAANITIDDTSLNEEITFTLNDFEGGFYINGNLVQAGLNNPVTVSYPESDGAISFYGNWDLGGALTNTSRQQILFLETAGSDVVSDVLTYTYNASANILLIGTFESDITGSLGVISDFPDYTGTWLEADGPYRFDNTNITASANSGADVSVPEPSILALFGIGFAGAGLARRKRNP